MYMHNHVEYTDTIDINMVKDVDMDVGIAELSAMNFI